MSVSIDNLNEDKLEQLQGKVIGDVSGAMGLLLSYIGDQLDLYSALSEIRKVIVYPVATSANVITNRNHETSLLTEIKRGILGFMKRL